MIFQCQVEGVVADTIHHYDDPTVGETTSQVRNFVRIDGALRFEQFR